MKRLLIFVFAVTLLASCSKILPGEIPNRLEGHWVDEADNSTNIGTAYDKVIIILSDGTAQLQDDDGWKYTADASIDKGMIVFRNGISSGSFQYSFNNGDLVLVEIIDGGLGSMGGTYEKQ